MTFIERLKNSWEKKNSLVCVGLDTDLEKIPQHLKNLSKPVFEFNKAIIDATAEYISSIKANIPFYTAYGFMDELIETFQYIHESYPDMPVILDAKRNDIGNTAQMYAKEVFDIIGADAVTVNPYMGGDTLEPFTERVDKGVIVLCRTSNPGAKDLQDLIVNGKKVYQIVAEKVANEWNKNNNLLLVVGATYPGELKEIRDIVGNIPILLPGIGAQGGDVKAAMEVGLDSKKQGLIVHSARGIIYAGSDENFADAAAEETKKLRDEINKYR
ncbi:orotidine-5'-phosphate decarboxylase [Candidatus Parcubacteria bacterium]|nr:MAG: orotidine-5'-phosphate decarboxylase [Candidatus Parcubacteria bacterium]